MSNWHPERARDYHESTKHWPGDALSRSVPASIIPRKYKLYEGIEAIPLPAPWRSDLPALSALFEEAAAPATPLDLLRLAALLHYSAGITRRVTRQGREMEFRAASCTGALYHIETYIVTGALPELDAGVYHFGVHDGALRQLRAGDYRGVIDSALCRTDGAEPAQAYLVHTSTWWRNAWRYEDRAYRHVFWDAGTIIANLLAVARAQGIEARLGTAFLDRPVNELIGVDTRREAAVSIVAVGRGEPGGAATSVEPLALPVVPLSPVEIEYPAITALHEASSLESCEDLERWRTAFVDMAVVPPAQIAVRRFDAAASPIAQSETVEAVIERRGSGRRFRREAITENELMAVLRAVIATLSETGAGRLDLVEPFLIVNAVEGVEPGAYAIDSGALRLLRAGDFREAAGHLALDQAPASLAAVNLYFLSPLRALLERLGNRGYRAAQTEAGVRGGRVYLGAYALGLKATGLTFYDDEVIEFFGEAAARRDVMFLVAFGR